MFCCPAKRLLFLVFDKREKVGKTFFFQPVPAGILGLAKRGAVPCGCWNLPGDRGRDVDAATHSQNDSSPYPMVLEEKYIGDYYGFVE